MNQIDMIDIQRRAIQIVDIKRQPRRIKNNYREETMSAVMTVVAMGAMELHYAKSATKKRIESVDQNARMDKDSQRSAGQ